MTSTFPTEHRYTPPPIVIKWMGLITFITTILFTWKLWINERNFPQAALIHLIPDIQHVDLVLILFFIGLAMLLCFTQNRVLFLFFILLLVVLMLQDLNRMQTWVYIFMLIISPFFLIKDQRLINSFLRLVFIGIYFWSGVHKLNVYFAHNTGYKILTLIFQINPHSAHRLIALSYFFSITEMLFAFALFFRFSRKLGVIMIILMHIFICFVFIPLVNPANYIVIPWNITMAIGTYILFYHNRMPIFSNLRLSSFLCLALLMVWVCPLGSYFNLWPQSMSFSLYASKNRSVYVAVSDRYWPKIQAQCSKYLISLPKGTSGGVIINMDAWAQDELHVLMPSEIYVYKKVCNYFCQLNIPPTDIQFMSYDHEINTTSLIKWTCEN